MACSKEKEVLFNVLDLYRDMPYLWLKSHKDYSNQPLRTEGFRVLLEIYKTFDEKATVKTIKKKLMNMRTNYNKELSKVCTYLIPLLCVLFAPIKTGIYLTYCNVII